MKSASNAGLQWLRFERQEEEEEERCGHGKQGGQRTGIAGGEAREGGGGVVRAREAERIQTLVPR